MKSFADWTQDIADTVGEVQQHWETRKEAELKGMDEEMGAIAPQWMQPGAAIPMPPPAGQMAVAYDKCAYCNEEDYLYPYRAHPNMDERHICRVCLNTVAGGTP